MGGMLSNQVPVPDERMQHMIKKLKRKWEQLLQMEKYVVLALTPSWT